MKREPVADFAYSLFAVDLITACRHDDLNLQHRLNEAEAEWQPIMLLACMGRVACVLIDGFDPEMLDRARLEVERIVVDALEDAA